MRTNIIPDQNRNGFYTTFATHDFERVNPVEYYKSVVIDMTMTMERNSLYMEGFPIGMSIVDEILFKRALIKWKEYYFEITNTSVPEEFLALLESNKKREQIKLLKGQGLTVDQKLSFFFKAWEDYGYTLSQYEGELYPKDINPKDLPKIAELNEDEVNKVGATKLSDGQIKHAISFRTVIVAKVLDREQDWHCFFTTYKSLSGKEPWKGGQAHMHYISNKFGISRDELVHKIKVEKSIGSSVHIDLFGR